MDRKSLKRLEEMILVGLVDFYYEAGHKADAYRDEATGGIYEHKLASVLKLSDISGAPSGEFYEACRMLEAQGYVRRNKRKEDFHILGIWPTLAGLDRAEYLKSNKAKKCWYHFKKNMPQIIISAVTTIITLLLSSLFGLFGLGNSNVP